MSDFFRRRRTRVALVGLAGLCCAALAAVVVACLPDLDTTPPPPPPPSGSYCGDGVIDVEAGEQCDPGAAAAVGCTKACAIDCDGGFVDDATGHCYFNVGPLAWSAAATRCPQFNGHVVTFVSDDEFDKVFTYGRATGDGGIWPGLANPTGNNWPNVTNDEPGWGPGCSGCYARVDDGGFDRLLDAAGGCLLAYAPKQPWLQVSCGSSHRTICEREPPGHLWQPCNGAICFDLPITSRRKRYVYFAAATANPDDAVKACGSPPLYGTLVVLESREEREQLWGELEQTPTPPDLFWIGLSREQDGGPFQWDDGTPDNGNVYPIVWGDRQPQTKGSRAYLERSPLFDSQLAKSAELNNAPPGSAPFFVCQYNPNTDSGAPDAAAPDAGGD